MNARLEANVLRFESWKRCDKCKKNHKASSMSIHDDGWGSTILYCPPCLAEISQAFIAQLKGA